ncbi:MAG: cysteine desulfurase [Clostridia bacterium]|nr:cysteine desulfurase [Clostridia bacterium]
MIYLDNAATTKPYLEALEYANKFNIEYFFNPSALYRQGLDVSKELKVTKDKILKFLGVTSSDYDVIFTSCGSESNNTAIFCSVKRGVFVTDMGEHAAVYKCFQELKNRGAIVDFISLNNDGKVNEEELYDYLKYNKTDFVSIMHVNNETGAINDVNKIAQTVKSINPSTIFHCDGVQAFGKLPYRLSRFIDFYSISAHKINAIKGVGVLVRNKKAKLSPLIYGGGQESGYRSGTENVFGIKVFEKAMDLHYASIKENFDKVLAIKNYVIDNLDKNLFKIISSSDSSPYILSISAVGLKGEIMMHLLEDKGIIVGNGSACSSKNPFSRVISSCGYKKDVLDGVIRVSFSAENTLSEAEFVVNELNENASRLKGLMK